MPFPSQRKTATWGVAGGAVAFAIIGFALGGAVLGGTAYGTTDSVVVSALAPIEQFRRQSDARVMLLDLRGIATYRPTHETLFGTPLNPTRFVLEAAPAGPGPGAFTKSPPAFGGPSALA